MTFKFSIGYNHDIHLLKLVEHFKSHIESIYFPIPNEYMGSGRAIPQEREYKEEIKQIISKTNALGIKSLILLNATCEGKQTAKKEYFADMINYLKELSALGLKGVVITNPMWIAEIKKEIPSLEIQASVNCYVKTVEHAMFLKQMGLDVLTVDRDINRDISLIKEIKEKTGLKIKILLNEGCLRNCPFRAIHFNMISHGADTVEFDKRSCITTLKMNPEKFFHIPFIRPEDIKYYSDAADYFKLSTRSMDAVKIGIVLEAYINQKFDGDLLFLLSGKGIFEYFTKIDNSKLGNDFFERIIKCKDNCQECNYCKELLKAQE